MVKALMGMPQLKGLPKPLMQSIVDIAAGDIRSAINCATLVALQLRQTPRRKVDVSM
jgi:DNA polymerase III delta prime subunit